MQVHRCCLTAQPRCSLTEGPEAAVSSCTAAPPTALPTPSLHSPRPSHLQGTAGGAANGSGAPSADSSAENKAQPGEEGEQEATSGPGIDADALKAKKAAAAKRKAAVRAAGWCCCG